MMNVWTVERVARSLGCSLQQIKRWCDLGDLPYYTDTTDRLVSRYPYRIIEEDLLKFLGCETVDEFKKLQYR
jgi:hypothetical protein